MRLRLKARKRLLASAKYSDYKNNPTKWLAETVSTLDPFDKKLAIKPFPVDSVIDDIIQDWLANKLFAMAKSRRMKMTWLFVALHTWLFEFFNYERIFIAARKEGRDDSAGALELLARSKLILQNHRNWTPPAFKLKRGRILGLDTHSEMIAVPQGEHQMRQQAATALLFDEFAFWEKARESYVNSRPTIEQKGRVTILSTAYPGFFADIVFDRAAL